MKKFILGVLVGVSITAAGSAYADDIVESIVGKQVQGSFPVKVDGKQLSTVAAVIDGTSYLPVRAIGEALDKEVTFDADLGIELKDKEVAAVTETTQNITVPVPDQTTAKTPTEQIAELQKMIDDEKRSLEKKRVLKSSNEAFLKTTNESSKQSVQQAIDMYIDQISAIEARITEYEAQITALEAK